MATSIKGLLIYAITKATMQPAEDVITFPVA